MLGQAAAGQAQGVYSAGLTALLDRVPLVEFLLRPHRAGVVQQHGLGRDGAALPHPHAALPHQPQPRIPGLHHELLEAVRGLWLGALRQQRELRSPLFERHGIALRNGHLRPAPPGLHCLLPLPHVLAQQLGCVARPQPHRGLGQLHSGHQLGHHAPRTARHGLPRPSREAAPEALEGLAQRVVLAAVGLPRPLHRGAGAHRLAALRQGPVHAVD